MNAVLMKINSIGIGQFIKFGFVGISNTVISYVVYLILVQIGVNYLWANVIGFLVSIVNAYYWNNKYVFKESDGKKESGWQSFVKTFISYAGTGLILNNILLVLWIRVLGIDKVVGPILNLFVSTPINFILNKYWAFRKRNIRGEKE